MTANSTERQLNALQARRMAAEDRALAKIEKRFDKAVKMIGELNGSKFYIFPAGGKYREASNRADLVDFLVRNNYV